MKLSLEQNLLDIKSMESNMNIHNVLMESSKATKHLQINVDDFESVTDKVRENVENLKEVNEIIGDVNGENLDNEELEKELNDLQIAEDKNREKERINKYVYEKEEESKIAYSEKAGLSRMFPSVNKNNVIVNHEEQVQENKNHENFINENSFQEILEELNKK